MSSGAPKGNKNAVNGRRAKQALEIALNRYEEPDKDIASGMKALVEVWTTQLTKAIEKGDSSAANMIIDRLDGRPKQAVVGGDEEDNPIKLNGAIQFIPVGNEPANKD